MNLRRTCYKCQKPFWTESKIDICIECFRKKQLNDIEKEINDMLKYQQRNSK